MIRNLNFTGRQRIKRELVDIVIDEVGGVTMLHCTLDLKPLNLPDDAKVYLEAYNRFAFMRLSCGTVGALTPPAGVALADLQGASRILCRVRVVSASDGVLLAVADALSCREGNAPKVEREPLLPVEVRSMGQTLWRVECSADGDGPVLCINDALPDPFALVLSSPFFRSLVHPEAMRQVLTEVVMIGRFNDSSGDDSDWKVRWLQFGSRFAGSAPPEFEDEPGIDQSEWIEKAVDGFADFLKARNIFTDAIAIGEEE